MDVIYLPVEGVGCRTMANLVPDIIHSFSVFLHPNILSVQRETRGEITDCLTESCSGLNSPVPRFNEELWIYISLSFHDPVSSPRSHRGVENCTLSPLISALSLQFWVFPSKVYMLFSTSSSPEYPSSSTTCANLMCYFLLTFRVMQNFCECNSDFTFAIVMKPGLSIILDPKLY